MRILSSNSFWNCFFMSSQTNRIHNFVFSHKSITSPKLFGKSVSRRSTSNLFMLFVRCWMQKIHYKIQTHLTVLDSSHLITSTSKIFIFWFVIFSDWATSWGFFRFLSSANCLNSSMIICLNPSCKFKSFSVS